MPIRVVGPCSCGCPKATSRSSSSHRRQINPLFPTRLLTPILTPPGRNGGTWTWPSRAELRTELLIFQGVTSGELGQKHLCGRRNASDSLPEGTAERAGRQGAEHGPVTAPQLRTGHTGRADTGCPGSCQPHTGVKAKAKKNHKRNFQTQSYKRKDERRAQAPTGG